MRTRNRARHPALLPVGSPAENLVAIGIANHPSVAFSETERRAREAQPGAPIRPLKNPGRIHAQNSDTIRRDKLLFIGVFLARHFRENLAPVFL